MIFRAADLFLLDGPFRVPEVAQALRCSPEYLYKCIHAGALTAGKVGDHYRIPVTEARRLASEAGLRPPGAST